MRHIYDFNLKFLMIHTSLIEKNAKYCEYIIQFNLWG